MIRRLVSQGWQLCLKKGRDGRREKSEGGSEEEQEEEEGRGKGAK